MCKEVVGKVSEEEKNEVMTIFERIKGIEELTYTFESDLMSEEEKKKMSEKMTVEKEKALQSMQQWWNKMHEKYQFKSVDGMSWSIDFQTCEILLVG